MPTTIKLKNSVTTTNAPSSLAQGEVAINVTDKKVWVGNAATTPVLLLGSGADGTFTNLTVSGVASFADGTVSLPSITNIGDTNTGIFFPAADTIAFTEGGVESMRIDSSGILNLTNNPILSAGTADGVVYLNGSKSATSSSLLNFSGIRLQVAGTTSSYNAFDTSGTGNLNPYTSGTSSLVAGSHSLWLGAYANAFYGTKIKSIYNYGSSNQAAMSFEITDGTSLVEAMRITANSNVGIGTSSPSQRLDIVTSSGFAATRFSNGTTTAICGVSNTNTGYLSTETNHPFVFQTNASERMRILSTGEVVVGKTNNDNSTTGIGLSLQQSNTAPLIKMVKTFSGGINSLVNWHNGTYVGGIDFNNTSTSFPTSSDIRLKKNIVNAGSATEKIDQIRIVSHGWKHDADEIVEFGIIAQELYAVAPQAVTKGDDGEEIEKTWGVDYSKLVPLLLKAHQEQQAIINNLTTRLNALEGK